LKGCMIMEYINVVDTWVEEGFENEVEEQT
jgi:hypothetical protein